MKWIFWLRWCISLCYSTIQHGIHLYSILDAQTRIQKNKTAFIIDEHQISFLELKYRTDQLICEWQNSHNPKQLPQQIGLMMQQDLDSLAALFALSRLGKDIIIVNPSLVQHKLQALIEQRQLHLIGSLDVFTPLNIQNFTLIPAPSTQQKFRIKPTYFNKISVCSSGSTGIPKVATRQSKPLQSLPLLDLMLRKLKFFKIKQIFVMTPLCHAAGLTASLMALSFHKTVILQKRFDPQSAKQLIKHHQIDCLNLVPTILYRLIELNAPLCSVQYIITGSAPLSANLVKHALQHYPQIQLFNLYGSSESGINLLATTADLKRNPESIGKAIQGVQIKIADSTGQPLENGNIGILWSKCAWSITPNQWLQCGDLAVQDAEGYYYLKGRSDDMLICGGVNVYPIDLENILYTHNAIKFARAYAIDDADLGQCLAVDIILNQILNIEELQLWISGQTPRYLRPKSIRIIDQIETDSIGKPV